MLNSCKSPITARLDWLSAQLSALDSRAADINDRRQLYVKLTAFRVETLEKRTAAHEEEIRRLGACLPHYQNPIAMPILAGSASPLPDVRHQHLGAGDTDVFQGRNIGNQTHTSLSIKTISAVKMSTTYRLTI